MKLEYINFNLINLSLESFLIRNGSHPTPNHSFPSLARIVGHFEWEVTWCHVTHVSRLVSVE